MMYEVCFETEISHIIRVEAASEAEAERKAQVLLDLDTTSKYEAGMDSSSKYEIGRNSYFNFVRLAEADETAAA